GVWRGGTERGGVVGVNGGWSARGWGRGICSAVFPEAARPSHALPVVSTVTAGFQRKHDSAFSRSRGNAPRHGPVKAATSASAAAAPELPTQFHPLSQTARDYQNRESTTRLPHADAGPAQEVEASDRPY